MTTFLLLRHARHGLLDRVLAGRMPGVSLSAEGREQAGRLAARVAEEFPGIAAVWSSPLERARETAEPLGARLGLAVGIAPELDEVDYGEWTGRGFDELENDPRWAEWNTHRAIARVPGGETMGEARARVCGALERWREDIRRRDRSAGEPLRNDPRDVAPRSRRLAGRVLASGNQPGVAQRPDPGWFGQPAGAAGERMRQVGTHLRGVPGFPASAGQAAGGVASGQRTSGTPRRCVPT